MRKMLIALSLLVAIVSLPISGYCSTTITAHVVRFGTYGSGNVYVVLDRSLDEVGCVGPYIELNVNNPAIKSVLAIASVALTTGNLVEVQTDGCFGGLSSTITARGYFGMPTS